jgi:methionyl-tRNA formyltransferase
VNIIFAGTPAFAATTLDALIAAGHRLSLVLTQPDRPAGRGQQARASPVKAAALAAGVRVLQPPTLRDAGTVSELAGIDADVIIVAAYGLLLPRQVLDIPRLGCLNVHASLLPRWRGAAPVQRALLAGDERTGISIMQMDAGLDTGPVLLERSEPIATDDTAGTLENRLARLGAVCMVEVLQMLESGPVEAHAQDHAGASYAAKVDKAEAAIDWNRPAAMIDRQIRAFNPAPAAFGVLRGERLKIWCARPVTGAAGAAGTICAVERDYFCVACADGMLQVTEAQRPGGKRLPCRDLLRGFALQRGDRFDI